MEDLIKKLKDKKELRGLSEEFILLIIKEYKKHNLSNFEELEKKRFNSKSKEFIDLKKHVRKRLRALHGVFQKNKPSKKKQTEYLESNTFNFYSEKTQKFLKSHRSTTERLKHYEKVYNETQRKTGKIKKLSDLGCGLNPISYSLLEELRTVYCVDINKEEINFLKKFISKNKQLSGEAEILDLTRKENLSKISKKTERTDCCFLFKVLDGLESVNKGSSKKLFKIIKSKAIVVSFSNISISGRNKINSDRKWFKEIIEEQKKQGKKTTKFLAGHEEYNIFY